MQLLKRSDQRLVRFLILDHANLSSRSKRNGQANHSTKRKGSYIK